MRTLALAAITMVTAFGGTGADAQRLGVPGASYPAPGTTTISQAMPQQSFPQPPVMQQPSRPYPGPPNGPRPVNGQGGRWHGGSRWGGNVGGHWQGGVNAPGGWNAYRRPSRGWRLPTYWVSPSFFIGDYAGYGLYAPPQGYGWQRYYDDAVLLDSRGRVRDSVYGLNWDGGYGDDYGYDQGGYGDGGYPAPYPHPLPPVQQNGNVTTYSTSSGYGYGYGGGGTTVVTIQSAPTVTTTTTEYVEEVRTRTRYVAPRRVYHAPRRVYRRPVRKCKCQVEQPIQGS